MNGLRAGTLPAQSDWLRVQTASQGIGVDRENNVINGFVMAQEGLFKTPGRGEFDEEALEMIVDLASAKPNGVKSRFAHPSLSGDGIGTFLGRAKNVRLERATVNDERLAMNGERTVSLIRGDLHLDPSSFDTPSGNLGKYVMDLAESDPDAMSSSLVIQADKLDRKDDSGKVIRDENGEPVAPLWRPKSLHASDVVDTGDAVDGFLSVEHLRDHAVRKASEFLDSQFAGASREVVEARCQEWLSTYLDLRFGAVVIPSLASERARLARLKT